MLVLGLELWFGLGFTVRVVVRLRPVGLGLCYLYS